MISTIQEVRAAKKLIEECKNELRNEGKSFDENMEIGLVTDGKYGERAFDASMGAEAIRKFLEELDLETLCKDLREELKTTTSHI